MSSELEATGAASIGGLSSATKADLSGQPCRNCGHDVSERFCPNCGQLAASFHRPIWSLIGETISDAFALDGRLARTLPTLLFRPGRLTKAYTSGKRARYVPPFRLFLLASVIFYLSLFAIIANNGWITDIQVGNNSDGTVSISVGENEEQTLVDADGVVDREVARELLRNNGDPEGGQTDEVADRLANVFENPRAFQAELKTWAPRLSVLLVPMTMLELILLHFWRRKIFVYDHAVHALHLHSWMYLTGTAVMLLTPLTGGIIWAWYGGAFAIYVWRSLMVSYGSGWLMSLLRLLNLLVFWIFIVFGLVLAAILVSGLAVNG